MMRLLGIAMAMSWIVAGSVASAATSGDPSCLELNLLWNARFQPDFNVRIAARPFDCHGYEAQLALSFYDLDAQFSQYPGQQKTDFYDLVRRRTRSVEIMGLSNATNINCTAGAAAYAVGTVSDGMITLCPFFLSASREDRASTLFHESRHLEKDDPRHVDCHSGRGASLRYACDQKFYDGQAGGSGYNADVAFYAANLLGKHRNELSLSVIQSTLNDMIPERFNEISVPLTARWRAVTSLASAWGAAY